MSIHFYASVPLVGKHSPVKLVCRDTLGAIHYYLGTSDPNGPFTVNFGPEEKGMADSEGVRLAGRNIK